MQNSFFNFFCTIAYIRSSFLLSFVLVEMYSVYDMLASFRARREPGTAVEDI